MLRVAALGALHVEIIRWLREHALGVERARPRGELLAHLLTWSADAPGRPRILLEALGAQGEQGDADRQMRALAREAFFLGWAVLSCGRGYYYGRPGAAQDWSAYRRATLRRAIAELRTARQLKHVREAEGRRQKLSWTAGRQLDLDLGARA